MLNKTFNWHRVSIKSDPTFSILLILAFILLSFTLSFAAPVTYTYDEAGRLIMENRGGTTIEYVYDAVGNLLERKLYTGPGSTLTINKSGLGNGIIASAPSGIDCGVDCTEKYGIGTQVTLTAEPDIFSEFAGWTGGGCSGTGSCIVTLNADATVTAAFNRTIADLLMTTVSGPSSAIPGQNVTISNTIKNRGGTTAPACSVGIYLSTDSTITTADTQIGTRTVPSLAAGAESANNTSVTIPTNTAPGTYYIGAIADNGNTVTESDETNNGLAGNQINIIQADLIMTAVSGPSTGSPGQSITVANTLRNQGTNSASASYVGFYLSTDATITTADTRIGTRYVASLAAGADSANNTSITIPSNTAPGTYYIGVIADYANAVSESDENNNSLTGNQITIIQADLIMTAVSGPSTSSPGLSITVANTLRNQGNGTASASYVGIYLSTDATITTADTLIGYRYVASLAAATDSANNTSVTIPSNTAPGTYYIGVIADYANAVSESDENNNALVGNQITITQADLVMTAVSGPATGSPGQSITVSNTLRNQGNGTASASYVGIYLSTDATITTADTLIGYRYVASLASGTDSANNTSVTIPANTPPGTYYIGAIADYAGSVSESDETNNSLAGNQITISRADLMMTAVSGPSTGSRGQNITVANTLKNQGGGDAFGSYVGIYLSTDSTITTADTRIGTRYVSSLASGAESANNSSVTIPSNLALGTYYIGVIADYGNAVPESDETNNSLTGNQITISQ